MNPLEDIIVAMKAKTPTFPFAVPDSVRPYNVTMPLGSTVGFAGIDPPTGQSDYQLSTKCTDFGWEYTWHCHILGHEENDMMRPLVLKVDNPLPPTNLVGVSGATGIDLTWAYAQGPTPATGFQVQRATGGGPFATLPAAANLPVTQLAFIDTTAVAGTAYRYQVVAFTGSVLSTPSNIVTATFLPPLPLAATNLVGVSGATGINLTWAYTQGPTPATGFKVQRATGAGVFATLLAATNLPVTQLTFVDTTAVLGTTYRYQVVAFTGAVLAPPSNIITVTFVVPPLAPATNLVAASVPTGISLSWNYVQGFPPATGFRVQRTSGKFFSTLPAAGNLPVTQLTFIDTTAVLGTTYRYQVIAFSGAVVAAPSNIVTATLGAAPLAATNLVGVSGTTGVNLTWAYTQGSTPATGLQVQRATGAGAFATLPAATNLPVTQLSFIDTTTVLGTTYRYQVVAFSGTMLAAPSNIVTVPFVGPTPLAATNLAGVSGATGINLTWAYTQGPTPATGFQVQRATGAGAFATLPAAANLPLTPLSFIDTTAVVGTSYRYQVVAFNGAVLAPPSNIVTVTFIGAAPLAATNLVATNGVNGVALSWNYVQGSTPATGFMVQRATTKGFTTLTCGYEPACNAVGFCRYDGSGWHNL